MDCVLADGFLMLLILIILASAMSPPQPSLTRYISISIGSECLSMDQRYSLSQNEHGFMKLFALLSESRPCPWFCMDHRVPCILPFYLRCYRLALASFMHFVRNGINWDEYGRIITWWGVYSTSYCCLFFSPFENVRDHEEWVWKDHGSSKRWSLKLE